MDMIESVKPRIHMRWQAWVFIPFIALMSFMCVACRPADGGKTVKTISDVGAVRAPGRVVVPGISDAERFGLVSAHSRAPESYGWRE